MDKSLIKHFIMKFKVTVQTESERQIDKLRRKEEKKNKRGIEYGSESDFSAISFSSLVQASQRKSPFDDLIGSGEGTNSLTVSALPQGTQRKHFKGYEEVIIPAIPAAQMKPGEKLVSLFIIILFVIFISECLV